MGEPFALPSGLVLRNRLAKAAMSECLADGLNNATAALVRLYERWADGGASLLVTGNVMVDRRFLERPSNVVVDDSSDRAALQSWANAAKARGAAIIGQLNHPGRQTMRIVSPHPVAPSEGDAVKAFGAFARPRALTHREVLEVRDRFARAAQILSVAGFNGVQIHAAHGYLLNQFLSPRTNFRTDEWGGDVEHRARLILQIVDAVRASTPPGFTIAVKLNSSDFQRGGFDQADAVAVTSMLEGAGIDLLEISGGSYERPASLGETEGMPREGYFLEFARAARKATKTPIMLTGGMRSARAIRHAIAEQAIDIAGLARPLATEPDLPARLLAGLAERAADREFGRVWPRQLNSLAVTAWHWVQLRRLAVNREPNYCVSAGQALAAYAVHDLAAALSRAHSAIPIQQ